MLNSKNYYGNQLHAKLAAFAFSLAALSTVAAILITVALMNYALKVPSTNLQFLTSPMQLAMGILALLMLLLIVAAISYEGARRFLIPIRQESKLIRQFTQDAGHELATPISVMQSQLELMEREAEQSERQSKQLKNLIESAAQLSKLVDDMRYLSRSENPYLEHQLSIIALDKLAKSVMSRMEEDFEKHQIKLLPDRIESLVLLADKDGLERAFSNLLSNAMRYGRENGKTLVSVYQENGSAWLLVRDDGKGISAEALPHLFNRYYSADRLRSEFFKGSGLGLSIVKSVVTAHGGKISVKSKEGEGTEFIMELPLAPNMHPLMKLTGWDRFTND